MNAEGPPRRGRPRDPATKREAICAAMRAALTIEASGHRRAPNIAEASRRVARLLTKLGRPLAAKTLREHWYRGEQLREPPADAVRVAAQFLALARNAELLETTHSAIEAWYRRRLSRGCADPFDLASEFIRREQTSASANEQLE